MTYTERQALNGLLANKKYFDAVSESQISTGTVGTAERFDGLTGQIVAAIADGSQRFASISTNSVLGVTSPAYARGNSGNGGYVDGR